MWQSQVPGGTGCFGLVSGMDGPLLERADRAAQFGQALEAADPGIAGIDAGLLDVIEHAMPVIRAERDAPRLLAPGILDEQDAQDLDHVHVALEMVGLSKTETLAGLIDPGGAQV